MAKGGAQKVTQTTKNELSPEQQQLLNAAMPNILQYLNNPPKLPGYSGVAGFNPNQTAAQQGLLGTVAGQQGVANDAASANRFLMTDVLSPDSNPYLRQTIDAAVRPISQNLMETVLPGIRGEAVTAGQFGSSRQGIAEGLASGRASQAIGDTSAGIANQGYQSGLDAMVKGLALTPQTLAAMTQPSLTQGAVGDVQQNMQQRLLDEKMYRDLYTQIAPFLASKEVLGLSSGFGGGSNTSSSSTTGGSGGLGSAISGGLGGLSLAAGLGAGPLGMGGGALLGLLGSLFG